METGFVYEKLQHILRMELERAELRKERDHYKSLVDGTYWNESYLNPNAWKDVWKTSMFEDEMLKREPKLRENLVKEMSVMIDHFLKLHSEDPNTGFSEYDMAEFLISGLEKKGWHGVRG